MNNVAWKKLAVSDSVVNFSICFASGSLSAWVNGSYGVASDWQSVILNAINNGLGNISIAIHNIPPAGSTVYNPLTDPGMIVVLAIGSLFIIMLAYLAARVSINKAVQKTIRRFQAR